MKKTKPLGFTLIEMVIVAALVAVLTAIAWTNYKGHVTKGKAADAKAALTAFANAMELWRMQNNNSYLNAAGTDVSPTNTGSPRPSIFPSTVPITGGTATYNLSITNANTTTYTLSATPVDTSQATLTLQQNGTKSW